MMLVVCAGLAGLAVALLCGPGPRQRLRSRLPPLAGQPGGLRSRSGRVAMSRHGLVRTPPGHAGPRRLHLLAPVAGGVGVLLVLGPSGALLGLTAGLVTLGASWLHTGGVRRRRRERAQRGTVEVCDALAAELRAGQPAAQALQRAAAQHPVLAPVARVGVLGGDVPGALREVAASTGAAGMATLAAAWQVAEGSGSGLVAALERVSEGLRADVATQEEVGAALSPARATARLLAVLPVFGLLLGSGLGGHPLDLLLTTLAGNLLLLLGVALALAGTLWVERLATRVEAGGAADLPGRVG